MKKTVTWAAALLVAAGATGVRADISLAGSDTLELLTERILSGGGGVPACPGTASVGGVLTYGGGGSSTGQNAMAATPQTQLVAPMSSALSGATTTGACVADSAGNRGRLAEAVAHSLDGLAIVRDKSVMTANGDLCDGVAYGTGNVSFTVTDVDGDGNIECGSVTTAPDTNGSCSGAPTDASATYTFAGGAGSVANWMDVLRLIYAGAHHNDSNVKANYRCDSDARKSLVADWDELFANTSCSGAENCTQLRHAFRRSDLSGTTDTFLSLLKISGIANAPFCNGNDRSDSDPIRRDCDVNEQVCQHGNGTTITGNGTLGLVQSVFVPENLSAAQAYPTDACSDGVYGWALAPDSDLTCPNNGSQAFGKCLTPKSNTMAVGYACLSPEVITWPFGTPSSGADLDGRVYNKIMRDASTGQVLQDASGIELKGSYYRLHSTTSMPDDETGLTADSDPCNEVSATLQIGCLAQANRCSIGFAGREAETLNPDTASLKMKNIPLTVASVRDLIVSPSTAYPLARKLWFNTTGVRGQDSAVPAQDGFAGVNYYAMNTTDAAPAPANAAAQYALYQCYSDRYYADAAATFAGFITLDATDCSASAGLGGACAIAPTAFANAGCTSP